MRLKRQPLLNVLARPRDPALSAGARGDQLNLAVWTRELAEQGYSERAVAIIAYIFHHHLETPLEEAVRGWQGGKSRVEGSD